jgi:hypothetical protein
MRKELIQFSNSIKSTAGLVAPEPQQAKLEYFPIVAFLLFLPVLFDTFSISLFPIEMTGILATGHKIEIQCEYYFFVSYYIIIIIIIMTNSSNITRFLNMSNYVSFAPVFDNSNINNICCSYL